jgi:hypothetical protein
MIDTEVPSTVNVQIKPNIWRYLSEKRKAALSGLDGFLSEKLVERLHDSRHLQKAEVA